MHIAFTNAQIISKYIILLCFVYCYVHVTFYHAWGWIPITVFTQVGLFGEWSAMSASWSLLLVAEMELRTLNCSFWTLTANHDIIQNPTFLQQKNWLTDTMKYLAQIFFLFAVQILCPFSTVLECQFSSHLSTDIFKGTAHNITSFIELIILVVLV